MTREWAANGEISFSRNLAKGFSQTDNSLQSKSLLAIFKTMESWNKNSMWYNRNFNQNFFTYWQEKKTRARKMVEVFMAKIIDDENEK